VELPADLDAALAELPGDELQVIQYLDARGADGMARKYRVMMVDGEIYPLHVAVLSRWKIHYFSADMMESAANLVLNERGEVLVFEANAIMVVMVPDKDSRWDYRRDPVERIYKAVWEMLRVRAHISKAA
jgi:hypothetical protein